MLTSATIDGLKALRLHAMAAALADQNEQAGYAGLGFDERLGLLVDRELTDRASRRIQRSLKAARLRTPAAVEDIDFRHPRGLDRARILDLAQAHWAAPPPRHRDHRADRRREDLPGLRPRPRRDPQRPHRALPARPADARRPGHRPRRRAAGPPDGRLGPHRPSSSSTTCCSAPSPPTRAPTCSRSSKTGPGCAPPSSPASCRSAMWHEAIGDPTIADAALDRILDNAERIELSGESMRRAPAAASPGRGQPQDRS